VSTPSLASAPPAPPLTVPRLARKRLTGTAHIVRRLECASAAGGDTQPDTRAHGRHGETEANPARPTAARWVPPSLLPDKRNGPLTDPLPRPNPHRARMPSGERMKGCTCVTGEKTRMTGVSLAARSPKPRPNRVYPTVGLTHYTLGLTHATKTQNAQVSAKTSLNPKNQVPRSARRSRSGEVSDESIFCETEGNMGLH
jgi:hypothetical protein